MLAFILPLRVVGAESMALRMALHQTDAVAAAVQQAAYLPQPSMEMDHSMSMEDCPLMGRAAHQPDGSHRPAHDNCQTCQICMVWATPPALDRLPAGVPA